MGMTNNGGNGISRSQGYQQNAWKEAEAKEVWVDLMQHLGIEVKEVTEKFEQINKGDFTYTNLTYAELKGQEIGKYAQNVIEIGEYETGTTYHLDGHLPLSAWLNTHGIDLSQQMIRERNYTKPSRLFGSPTTFNLGFHPLLNGADIWYVNRTSALVYYYPATTLLKFILTEFDNDRLYWMGGRANETTLAVFVPNSQVAWKKIDGVWQFVGTDVETAKTVIELHG